MFKECVFKMAVCLREVIKLAGYFLLVLYKRF